MTPNLPFHDLAQRHSGVTDAIGASYTEAACVCLDRHHVSPVQFEIGTPEQSLETLARWQAASERALAAWANDTDATESGAYGIALAAIELAEGMVAVRRAETRTGADYYVAPSSADVEDLEGWRRLEISGVDRGDNSLLTQRLQQKVNQTLNGTSNLPALAIVVGFKAKYVAIARADVL